MYEFTFSIRTNMVWKVMQIVFLLTSVAADEPRIAGGIYADISEFPYQVSLQTKVKGKNRHFCGGSIISEKWILTAAHCIRSLSDEMLQTLVVVAGSTRLSQAEKQGQIVASAGEFHIHPNYKGGVQPDDIAVFKVEPLQFTDKVRAIQLPADGAHFAGTVSASGWGSTRFLLNIIASNTPDVLRKATYQLMDIQNCREAFGTAGEKVDKEANICTETLEGSFPSSMCSGDSGGPLVQNGTVIGIVSWGNIACGIFPSVYTRVAHYVDDFIKVHVEKL